MQTPVCKKTEEGNGVYGSGGRLSRWKKGQGNRHFPPGFEKKKRARKSFRNVLSAVFGFGFILFFVHKVVDHIHRQRKDYNGGVAGTHVRKSRQVTQLHGPGIA